MTPSANLSKLRRTLPTWIAATLLYASVGTAAVPQARPDEAASGVLRIQTLFSASLDDSVEFASSVVLGLQGVLAEEESPLSQEAPDGVQQKPLSAVTPAGQVRPGNQSIDVTVWPAPPLLTLPAHVSLVLVPWKPPLAMRRYLCGTSPHAPPWVLWTTTVIGQRELTQTWRIST